MPEKDHGAEDPETREEFLDIILTETDRLTRLIENVLDLTKVRSLEQPKLHGTSVWP